MQKVKIIIKDVTLYANFFDTKTSKEILNILPLEAIPEEWGDEFYFEIPLKMPLDETATTSIEVGDIGYWPTGNAIAIFFGPTPISKGPEPAGKVNLVGKIIGDATLLRKVKGADKIRIEIA